MISNNNHITWSAEDIRRYWNGQLSAEEMHAMEKAALDDPFLADAMEGYGEALKERGEIEVTGQLRKLHEQVWTQPATDKRTATVVRFQWWKLAAAALVIVVAGFWIFTSNKESKQSELATVQESQKQQAPVPPVTDSNAQFGATVDKAEAPSAPHEEVSANASTPARKDPGEFKQSNERGLESFQSRALKGYEDSVATYRARTAELNDRRRMAARLVRPDSQKSDDKLSTTPSIVSSSAPLSIKDTIEPKREMEVVVFSDGYKSPSEKKSAEADKANKEKFQNFITGVVTDNKNNPLANAYLQINNFNNQYTTDLRGQFRIPVQDTVVKVSVTVPGYANAQFRLKSSYDGTGYAVDNKLQLQPQNAPAASQGALSNADQKFAKKKEVARSVLNEGDYIMTVTTQDAQPVYGWVGYEQYLEENKKRPTDNPHLVGEVAVSFTVDKKQQLSDFKVEKSLSPQHDAEALRLVREGPAWKLRKGRKARVTVVVRF